MTRHSTHAIAFLGVLGLGLAATPAHALVTVYEKDDVNLKAGLLLQPQLLVTQHGTAADNWAVDPFIRRARIMLAGKYTEKIHFFVETDNPNFGKNGDWTTTGDTFIQDAFIEYNLGKPLRIDAGMLLMPFSHHAFQGAGSLLTMDYHTSMIKYPQSKVWRDAGVMFRGSLAQDKFDYRLAITNGLDETVDSYVDETGATVTYEDNRNPADLPRVMARVNVNVFDSDDGPGAAGFFADGIYLKENENGKLVSDKKLLSIGAAVDYQAKAVRDGEDLANWMGVAADATWDLPVGDKKHSLNGQVNYYMYNFGEGHAGNGMGLWGDLGYRVHRVQPLVAVEWWKFAEKEAEAGDFTTILGGVNWWYKGHTANLKGQVGATRFGHDSCDQQTHIGCFNLTAGLQAQLMI